MWDPNWILVQEHQKEMQRQAEQHRQLMGLRQQLKRPPHFLQRIRLHAGRGIFTTGHVLAKYHQPEVQVRMKPIH